MHWSWIWAVVSAVDAAALDVRRGDVVVYGATGAGCVAAIAASRAGAQDVILLSQTGHVGGMLTGGLMHTDSANDTVIQGITREFFVRTERQYPGRPADADYPPGHGPPGWLFESHVGERVLVAMLAEANVSVVRRVVNVASVTRGDAAHSARVTSLAVEGGGGGSFAAPVFVDASYEGDLLARAGCSMVWGREAAAQYGEYKAGRQPTTSFVTGGPKGDKNASVNPWWDASATPLVPLPHVSAAPMAPEGGADGWIEPMTFRLCFTDSPANRLPFDEPASYNASEWELWRRLYQVAPPSSLASAGLSCLGPVPNNYSDCGAAGNGPCRKCDMLGMNHGGDMTNGANGYPNGTTAERAAIWRAHIEYLRGLLWFWQTDAAVPPKVRAETASWGHCTDEYDADSDPPHWPHQLYVREAKRLVGGFVWTEFEANATLRGRSVGLGSYNFDSHYVARRVGHASAGGGDPAKDTVVKEGRIKVQEEQTPAPAPTPAADAYGCVAERCVLLEAAGGGGGGHLPAGCGGACAPLAAAEWLAVTHLSALSDGNRTLTVRTERGENSTWLKKSERLAAELPADLKQSVQEGQVLRLARPATTLDGTYLLVEVVAVVLEGEAALGDGAGPQLDDDSQDVVTNCGVCMKRPFEMPYDAMLPQAAQASNVLGPVALSATHIRYNAIRMEPTWMILGQAAGVAAAMVAADASGAARVHDVDVTRLQATLVAQKQLLFP